MPLDKKIFASVLEGTGISCLRSGLDVIAIAATFHLELLQPLGGFRAFVDWHGGGHEEHARQQGEDEEEPLGVHGEDRGVRGKVWGLRRREPAKPRAYIVAIIPLWREAGSFCFVWDRFTGQPLFQGPVFFDLSSNALLTYGAQSDNAVPGWRTFQEVPGAQQ